MEKEKIKKMIARFYSPIKDYAEDGTGTHTRYKSWEWCHKAFLDRQNKTDKELSLHLAFYLASWGMYRGSSFLLQRDYMAHKKAVEFIREEQYTTLWDYDPEKIPPKDAHKLLFGKEAGIYHKIKSAYGENANVSDTLVTKILMGTFGCIPAFDRFFLQGLKAAKFAEEIRHTPEDLFIALANFAKNNCEALHLPEGAETACAYPVMKCVDMYFWQIGFERDLIDRIDNPEVKKATKVKLLEMADTLGIKDYILEKAKTMK